MERLKDITSWRLIDFCHGFGSENGVIREGFAHSA
jgi:hypothetical protein